MSSDRLNVLSAKEKYWLYENSVQYPQFDIDFFVKEYRYFYKSDPRILCEDFCGTGNFSCEWVKNHPQNVANSVDIDPLPISYGKEHHLASLNPDQRKRLNYIEQDVVKYHLHMHKADIVSALNYAVCFFKRRKNLLEYFSSVKKSMHAKSLFIMDAFGGEQSQLPNEEDTEHDDDKFIYHWECHTFNPITNEGIYKIHYTKQSGSGSENKRYQDVFVYDWRLWSIAELKELLLEAGFSKVHCYWEGDDEDGGGDGNFVITEVAENCDSWNCYLVAQP
ncbi:MAG: class I SAM-dependent methyltransferase [Oligoflexia bacterium]|nr:class I SAM-dependent methyltransferase [Oligoflexia bacterium]